MSRDFLDLAKSVEQLAELPFSIDALPDVHTLEARTEWLIEDLIPRGAITLLTGDSGVGKSTLALALAGAVAHGERFLGRAAVQAHTLYADAENPLSVVKERLERLGIAPADTLRVWGGWNE